MDRNKQGNRKRKIVEESEGLSHTSKKIKKFETDAKEKSYFFESCHLYSFSKK